MTPCEQEYYRPRYRGELYGVTDPEPNKLVETFVPRHRLPSYPDYPGLDTAWEHHPKWASLYLAHRPRHLAAS